MLTMIRKLFQKKKSSTPLMESLDSLDMSAEDLQIIQKINEMTREKVEEIMTPRADIEWLDLDKPLTSLKSKLMRADHSYIILSRQNLDKVVGKISARDALVNFIKGKKISLEKQVTPVLYVSPSLNILDLIIKMKKAKNFMALVVDEFGGVDGLITAHDIMSEVIGEVDFRAEKIAAPVVHKKHTLILDGRYSIEDFEERYGKILTAHEKESDPETIAGLISSLAGRVPKKGEIIPHESGVRFEILECNPRKIIKVKAHNIDKLQQA
ncbi:MAG: transporter associated domain-containing protein [Alphaproteobacteria bacterium]